MVIGEIGSSLWLTVIGAFGSSLWFLVIVRAQSLGLDEKVSSNLQCRRILLGESPE